MGNSGTRLPAEFGDRFASCEDYVGGEGRTLRVADRASGRALVLKLLPPGIEPEEAAVLSGLRHPSIPAVVEVGRLADGRAFVLREHVDGDALTTLPSDLDELREAVREILAVLAFVHLRGVVHLDLKPANLLRSRSGRLVLLDFGLAARAGHRGRGGTPFFAAPELLLGAVADARADLFSVGAMVAQALWPVDSRGKKRKVPLERFLRRFPADGFWAAAGVTPEDFPPAFAPFLQRCLSRRPNRRFHDAQAAMEFVCGGSGRPSAGLLTPDPVALWQPEVAAVEASVEGDVVLRGAGSEDRRQLAMHLVASAPGFTAVEEHAEHVVVVRGAGTATEVALPLLDGERLAPHLRTTFGLDGEPLATAARWLFDRRCAGTAAVGEALLGLVELGEIVPAGSRWVWPAAQSGRLLQPAVAIGAATPESVRDLAAKGRREAAIACYRRGVGQHPEAEPALRHALAEGLLDGGEPARALPFCVDAPELRAQALLDMGQIVAAERELDAVAAAPFGRRRRIAAQLMLARGDNEGAVGTLVGRLTMHEQLTLAAAHETGGRIDECETVLDALNAAGPDPTSPYLRASALTVEGHLARRRGDLARAEDRFAAAGKLLFGIGHVRHAASAQLNRGVIAKDRGDHAGAIERLREARALFENVGDAAGVARAEASIGSTALAAGDAASARPRLQRAADQLAALGSH
ncbi:MAG: serine/threonine protein kinase, partial [Planctomycetes bacterium]|nr:serine/threonine protein kinase [Planctomycetota bacterium]